MKVIFLDIDGVLNSETHAKEISKLRKAGKATDKDLDRWDYPYEGTMLPLQKIVKETGAKIVLSSSWRTIDERVKVLENIFKDYDLAIMDKTCYMVLLDDLKKTGFNINKTWDAKYRKRDEWINDFYKYHTSDRGAEITMWLVDHPDVESFVILDDDYVDIQPYFKEQQVRTDFYGDALTMELANKAIEILNKPRTDFLVKKGKKK